MNLQELKELIEQYIVEYFDRKPEELKGYLEPMLYSLKVGGKRIRPILMMLTHRLYKNDCKEVLPFALAMEMIHTYSLVHDDLPSMDNDDLRRGMPTNHKKFGEARAILAGDGLLNEAMLIMINQCVDLEERKAKAAQLVAKAAGSEGMILGQIIDIESENKQISEEMLLKMHKNKTGQLIKASVMSGAILGGANEKELETIKLYGEKLGLAFQIKDDILDYMGDEKAVGKSLSDKENQKTNFVTMYGIEKCKVKCEELTNQCIELLNSLNKDVNLLIELTDFLLKRQY